METVVSLFLRLEVAVFRGNERLIVIGGRNTVYVKRNYF